MKKDSTQKIYMKELLYYIGAMILIGTKAIGLEERTIAFAVLFVAGSICIAFKMLLEEYTVAEILIIGLLVLYGIYAFFNMGSLGLLSLIILLVGMKDIKAEKVLKILAVEYTMCFLFTISLSIFEKRDGVELVHEKFGHILLRQSLGYAHPNVLHVTYVIFMVLILYTANKHGIELIKLIIVLLAGDAFVFMYSLSNTGLLMSFAAIISFLYMDIFHGGKNMNKSFNKVERILLYIWVPFSALIMIIIARLVTINNDLYVRANDIFNMRTICINVYYNWIGLSLFGRPYSITGVSLDCSYAYALFLYGMVFMILMIYAHWNTMKYLIKNNRFSEIAVFITLTFGGITEQFLFNISLKNLIIFMIGEWIYNSKFLERASQIPVLDKSMLFLSKSKFADKVIEFDIEQIKNRFWSKRAYSYILTGLCMGIIVLISTAIFSDKKTYDIVYAMPYVVDVRGVESYTKEYTDLDNEAYFVGDKKYNSQDDIYIFNNANSSIIKQIHIYNIIARLLYIIGFVLVICKIMTFKSQKKFM